MNQEHLAECGFRLKGRKEHSTSRHSPRDNQRRRLPQRGIFGSINTAAERWGGSASELAELERAQARHQSAGGRRSPIPSEDRGAHDVPRPTSAGRRGGSKPGNGSKRTSFRHPVSSPAPSVLLDDPGVRSALPKQAGQRLSGTETIRLAVAMRGVKYLEGGTSPLAVRMGSAKKVIDSLGKAGPQFDVRWQKKHSARLRPRKQFKAVFSPD